MTTIQELEEYRDRYRFLAANANQNISDERYQQGFKWKPGVQSALFEEYNTIRQLLDEKIKATKNVNN